MTPVTSSRSCANLESAACSAERLRHRQGQAGFGYRWPDPAASRLRRQPEEAHEDRVDLWLAEERLSVCVNRRRSRTHDTRLSLEVALIASADNPAFILSLADRSGHKNGDVGQKPDRDLLRSVCRSQFLPLAKAMTRGRCLSLTLPDHVLDHRSMFEKLCAGPITTYLSAASMIE